MKMLRYTLTFISITIAVSRVELYESGDAGWTCEDKGRHNHACGTNELPPLVSCKKWLTGQGEVKWECAPAENKYWRLNHTHVCEASAEASAERNWWANWWAYRPRDPLGRLGMGASVQERCTLHTSVTPKSEMSPILVTLLVVMVITILLCASATNDSGDAFWGAYLGAAACDCDDDDWGGSSWS